MPGKLNARSNYATFRNQLVSYHGWFEGARHVKISITAKLEFSVEKGRCRLVSFRKR